MARNKNKNKKKGTGGPNNNKKKNGTSIVVGEFEGDGVSSGSQSRSLGWGTFTSAGVDAGSDYCDDSEDGRGSNSQSSTRSSVTAEGFAVATASDEKAPEKAPTVDVKATPSTPDTAASLSPSPKNGVNSKSGDPFSSSTDGKDSSNSNKDNVDETKGRVSTPVTAMVGTGGDASSKNDDDNSHIAATKTGAAVVTGTAIAGGAIVFSKGSGMVVKGTGSNSDVVVVPSQTQYLTPIAGSTSNDDAIISSKGQEMAAVAGDNTAVKIGTEAAPYLGTVLTPTRRATDSLDSSLSSTATDVVSNVSWKQTGTNNNSTEVVVAGASSPSTAPGVFKGPDTLSKKDLKSGADYRSSLDTSRDITIDNTEALANSKHAEEERSRKAAVMVAGGAGAAALIMSNGGADAAPVDAGNESDASSQPNNNYLPTDLATTNKNVDTSPRATQGPISVGDGGAIEAVSRDLKITTPPKSAVVSNGDDEQDQNSEDSDNRGRGVFIFWLIFCCCLIIAAIILGVILSRDDDDSNDPGDIDRGDIDADFTLRPTSAPTSIPTLTPTLTPTIVPTLAPVTLSPVVPLNPTIQLPGGISDVLFGSSLAFSGDGQVLAVGNLDGWGVYDSASDDLTEWTPRTGATTRRLRSLQANNGGSLVGISGDGGTVAVADQGGARVRMYSWDGTLWTRIGNEVTEFTLSKNVQSLGFSGGGSTVAVGGEGAVQTLYFFPGADRWFPRGNLLEGTSALGEHVALSQDGRRLITTTSGTGELTAYEWRYDGNIWEPFGDPIPGAGAPIESLVMDASGTIIACGSQGSVRGYRFVDGLWVQLGSTLTGTEPSFGSALAMDSLASLLLVGANESDEFDVDAGEVRFYGYNGNDWFMVYDTIYGMQAGDRMGTSVSISPDGRVLAVSADQKDLPETGYVGIYERSV